MNNNSKSQQNLPDQSLISSAGTPVEKESSSKNLSLLILILLVLGLLVSTAYFAYQNQKLKMKMAKTSKETGFASEVIQKQQETKWFTVNYRGSGEGGVFEYTRFKIDYPSYYIVTTDDMLTSYISLGGSAPPSLIFSNRHAQVTIEEYKKMFENLDSFIFVNPMGLQEFEDLPQGYGAWFDTPTQNQVLSKTTEKINDYQVTKRVIVNPHNNKKALDALVVLSENVGYYFQASDEQTGKDLEKMLETFDTRGNYYLRNPDAF